MATGYHELFPISDSTQMHDRDDDIPLVEPSEIPDLLEEFSLREFLSGEWSSGQPNDKPQEINVAVSENSDG